jgi:hypothetical protein
MALQAKVGAIRAALHRCVAAARFAITTASGALGAHSRACAAV